MYTQENVAYKMNSTSSKTALKKSYKIFQLCSNVQGIKKLMM
jgi:hypothetical protein